jgi:hypothetical protein
MFPLLGERVRVRGYNKFSFDTLRLAAGLFIKDYCLFSKGTCKSRYQNGIY